MHRLRLMLVLAAGLMLAASVAAQERAATRTIILDTTGMWRMYHTLAPSVVDTGKGLEPIVPKGQKWFHEKTSEPPADWRARDFDDHAWLRGPARMACAAPQVSRLVLRGKFIVTDPRRVRDLKVTVGYYGGVILYLNGTELTRGHLKPGEDGRNGLAETYPAEAYYFGSTRDRNYRSQMAQKLEGIRTRKLENVAVPTKLLRKGVNVLAVEIVRPAEHESVAQPPAHKRPTPFLMNWPTCSLRCVQLTASSARGLVPNAVRPSGLQVWNSNTLANDFNLDFGDTAETLRPMEIAAARGGFFSGKVVVGSPVTIKGLKATVGDLAGPGRIPASAVRVRYGVRWGVQMDAFRRYTSAPGLLGALAESPPKEIPVQASRPSYYSPKLPSAPKPSYGAVTPIWVTVDVPRTASAGKYEATLTIRADGEKPVKVPVHLAVEDWTMPHPQDYRTWVELIQSPDTLVEEYKLKPWSHRHFELMTKTFKHLNRIGSRILYVPVICRTNIGNAESMVRWIEKPGGTYTWDFSLMDRYLDTATVHMGKPKVVVFWAWEKFMFPTKDDPKTYEQYRPERPTRRRRSKPRTADGPDQYIGRGPMVTVLDPATGKTENRHLPYLLDPISRKVWRPLFQALRARMKARGLEHTVMIGTPSDIVLRKDQFAFFNDVAPGWRWVNHSHFDVTAIYKSNNTRLGYYSTVMNVFFPGYPEDGRHYGWQRKALHAQLRSRWGRDYFTLTVWRHVAEVNITGKQRGVGRLGADFWKVIRNRGGHRVGRIFKKYPECGWRSNDLCSSLLAPGPDGPIATVRYEMTREGVQECEARIFIERALTDAKLRRKLGDDLAKRCQDALDERIRFMIKGMSNLCPDSYAPGPSTNAHRTWWNGDNTEGHTWFIGSGWEARTQKLFRLAGEVQKKLGG